MDYIKLCEKYNFEMPAYAIEYFEDFSAEYKRDVPVLSAENAAYVADATSRPEDGKQALIS